MTTSPLSPSPVTAPRDPNVRYSRVAGVVLLIFFLGGFSSLCWTFFSGKIQLLPSPVSWDEVRHGAVTQRLGKELAVMPIAEHAARLERAASWLLIADPGSRVRQGCPGWLFLAAELQLRPHAESNAQARAAKVLELREQLQQRGIELLVMVVPDKSRIAASELCGVSRSPQLAARQQLWLASLQAKGVPVLDLLPSLQPLASGAFLRTDTHWNEAGASAAAAALAARIQALGIKPEPLQSYQTSLSEPQARPGDLVRLAGLDWLPASLQPAGEQTRNSSFSAVAAASESVDEDDLFGDSQLPNIALIGTSFSRNSNFVGFLQRDLGASVGNFALDGGEFSGAAKAYFNSQAFKQTPPKLIVWEIPERDLQAPYVNDIVLDAK